MWLFLLFISGCIFSMERDDSLVIAQDGCAPAASSSSSSDLFTSPEEKEELFTRALCTVYPMGYDEINDRLKVYLERIVLEGGCEPDDDSPKESNISVLRKFRSGDIDDRYQNYIKRLVMRATKQAFDDQQKKLDDQISEFEKQKLKLESKVSKTSTAIIALLSSVVTSTASVLVAIYSNK